MDSQSEDIPSPCIQFCTLDAERICLGCFRSVAEITVWSRATVAQKKVIVAQALARKASSPSSNSHP